MQKEPDPYPELSELEAVLISEFATKGRLHIALAKSLLTPTGGVHYSNMPKYLVHKAKAQVYVEIVKYVKRYAQNRGMKIP